MDLRPLLLVPFLAVSLAACSQAQDVVDSANRGTDKVRDCTTLANDVLSSGLNRTPSQQDVIQAKQKLDKRVELIKTQEVKDAATGLRDKVDQLLTAVQSKDQAQVQARLTEVQAAARTAAAACNVPVGTFLG